VSATEETEGYAALVAARAPALLRLAVMLTGDRNEAEDLLQSTLARTQRHAGRIAAHAAPLEALTPEVMARVFGLAGRWVEGPDGPLLSSGRYSDASGSGVRVASSPA